MTPHRHIISRLGGIAATAHKLSQRTGNRVPKSTVQGWMESGYIPARWHDDVFAVGQALEDPIRAEDFLSPEVRDAASSAVRPPIGPRAPIGQEPFIHSSAFIDPDVVIGPGTFIWHNVHLLPGTQVGAGCMLGQNVMAGPGVIIGDGCRIQNNVSLYPGVTLEEGVFCGPSCVFTNVLTPRAGIDRRAEFLPTLVKRGATIGANATVLCGLTIGEYALIGAGAVVTRDVAPHAVVRGNPARRAGYACRCGHLLPRGDWQDSRCGRCGLAYRRSGDELAVV